MEAPVIFARTALTAFLSFGAVGCGVPQPPAGQPATAQPDRISYEGRGNGFTGGEVRWSIEPSGRGSYEMIGTDHPVSGRFEAGSDGFRQVRDLLAPLREVREMPCTLTTSDQPSGTLSWHHGGQSTTLRLDFGCAGNEEVWSRANQAAALIRDWATTRR